MLALLPWLEHLYASSSAVVEARQAAPLNWAASKIEAVSRGGRGNGEGEAELRFRGPLPLGASLIRCKYSPVQSNPPPNGGTPAEAKFVQLVAF